MPVVPKGDEPPLFGGQVAIVFGARPPRHPKLTQRFDDALVLASQLHRSQRRKGTDVPYVSHLMGVASIALELGADEDQAIAALLHDAVEDQGGAPTLEAIRGKFGDHVAGIVADCTDRPCVDGSDRPGWRERKQAYIASLANKHPGSLLVTLADKTHNARAIVDDMAAVGTAVWDRFTAGRDGSIWYYRSLAQALLEHLPGPGSDRLAALVKRMTD